MEKRSNNQNKALHLGCTQIADYLVENGISLQTAFKDLETRPTMESIKEIYKDIAKSKYGVDSTTQLDRKQIDQVWEDMTKALSINTGVHFPFPSEESRLEALESYEQYGK